MYRKIVLASDGSEHSLRAAEHAIHLATLHPEAHIIICYVVDGETSKSDVLRNLDTIKMTEKRLQKFAPIEQMAQVANVSYDIKIMHGEPGPTLVSYVNSNDIDIVILGSRGLNVLQEFVLGSVSHKVAKRARCPVMIIK